MLHSIVTGDVRRDKHHKNEDHHDSAGPDQSDVQCSKSQKEQLRRTAEVARHVILVSATSSAVLSAVFTP